MPNAVYTATATTIKLEPAHFTKMNGIAFMVYADRYREVALAWIPEGQTSNRFDPVSYQLLCQSLELYLKSFIWLTDQIGEKQIKNKYGHNLQKLWDHSKTRGIGRYARTTPLRDTVISLVAPYYKNRQFTYLDLEMIFKGFSNLKAEPRCILTLRRLTGQLGKSIRTRILEEA